MTDLTDSEIHELVNIISKPVFNFMIKRIGKEMLNNKKYNNMTVNCFINIITMSMACIDANLLRWMQNFYKLKVEQDIDFNKLHMCFSRNLYDQLKIILQ